jgi:RNA polymerase sigma-70 factor (ECF subfamily)
MTAAATHNVRVRLPSGHARVRQPMVAGARAPRAGGLTRAGIGETPEELALRARSGSVAGREAYEALVVRFHGRLLNFLLRRLALHDAEDVAQETFVRAWQRIGLYRPRWRFSTWLFTIATRAAASHARRAPRAARAGLPEHLAAPAEGSGAGGEGEGAGVWRLVDEVLTPEQRTAVWLRYVEDLSMQEIGVVMSKSPVAVRVMLHRARAELADVLEGSGMLEELTARTGGER